MEHGKDPSKLANGAGRSDGNQTDASSVIDDEAPPEVYPMRRHHAGTVTRSLSVALATIVLSAGCITNNDPAASYEETETDTGTAPSDASTAGDASETSTAEPSASDEPSTPPADVDAATPPPPSSSKDAGPPAPAADAGTPAPSGSPCGTAVSFKANVAPLFTTSCSGCHANKLSTASGAYSFLTTQSSGCGPLVVPGNTTTSSLVRLLQGSTCGSRMPKGGPYMTSTQLGTINAWICQGAKND